MKRVWKEGNREVEFLRQYKLRIEKEVGFFFHWMASKVCVLCFVDTFEHCSSIFLTVRCILRRTFRVVKDVKHSNCAEM